METAVNEAASDTGIVPGMAAQHEVIRGHWAAQL